MCEKQAAHLSRDIVSVPMHSKSCKYFIKGREHLRADFAQREILEFVRWLRSCVEQKIV